VVLVALALGAAAAAVVVAAFQAAAAGGRALEAGSAAPVGRGDPANSFRREIAGRATRATFLTILAALITT